VCPHTGQVILEKSVKLFGIPVIYAMMLSMVLISAIIGTVIYNVDDPKTKRMTLL
jgi:hypothetical protein